jgi:hypothetical protein
MFWNRIEKLEKAMLSLICDKNRLQASVETHRMMLNAIDDHLESTGYRLRFRKETPAGYEVVKK